MSETSKKSVKEMNASLERIHTFGMSAIHKGLHDQEKEDNQYIKKKDKKIVKTTSLAKLKNLAIGGDQGLQELTSIRSNSASESQSKIKISSSQKTIDPNLAMTAQQLENVGLSHSVKLSGTDTDPMLPPNQVEDSLPDFLSSISNSHKTISNAAPAAKTSYYVRDKFKPQTMHQTNIEKMLI